MQVERSNGKMRSRSREQSSLAWREGQISTGPPALQVESGRGDGLGVLRFGQAYVKFNGQWEI